MYVHALIMPEFIPYNKTVQLWWTVIIIMLMFINADLANFYTYGSCLWYWHKLMICFNWVAIIFYCKLQTSSVYDKQLLCSDFYAKLIHLNASAIYF